MSDTLTNLTNIGVGLSVGGAVVPPVDDTSQLLHIIIGVLTGITQIVVILKSRKKSKSV